MNYKDAIKAIKDNYPLKGYSTFREALDLAISTFEEKIKESECIKDIYLKYTAEYEDNNHYLNLYIHQLLKKYNTDNIFELKDRIAKEILNMNTYDVLLDIDKYMLMRDFNIVEEEYNKTIQNKSSSIVDSIMEGSHIYNKEEFNYSKE